MKSTVIWRQKILLGFRAQITQSKMCKVILSLHGGTLRYFWVTNNKSKGHALSSKKFIIILLINYLPRNLFPDNGSNSCNDLV
jgi:hypothetical protein